MLDALRALWQPEPIIALQRIFGPAWRPVLEVLSLLGGHQLVVLALCWARWFRGRHLACRLLVAALLGLAASMILGTLLDTPRPDDPRIWVATQIPISSFPSGHLITCMTVWGTFAAARLLRPYVVAVLAVLIALGRLGLGQHYPGDLLGGALIGLLILAVVAWPWLRGGTARVSPQRWLLVGIAVAAVALAGTLVVSDDRWELLGLLLGVAIALPAEQLAVGYIPRPLPWRTTLLKGALGFAGIGVYIGAAAAVRGVPSIHNLLLPTLLALWALLGAPALFRRLDWSKPPALLHPDAAALA